MSGLLGLCYNNRSGYFGTVGGVYIIDLTVLGFWVVLIYTCIDVWDHGLCLDCGFDRFGAWVV